MSSSYLEWKYRDVQPDAPRVLSKKEKRQNWWHYHKLHVLLFTVLLLIVLSIFKSALHIGEVMPDAQIAYVGTHPLPADTAAAIEGAFASFAEDANADGRITIRLVQYVTGEADGRGTAGQSSAASVALLGDLEDRDSYFFILEDAETFQEQYDILRTEQDMLADCFCWRDCPMLSSLPLGSYKEEALGTAFAGESNDIVSGLFLARRRFAEGREAKYMEACDALWEALTKGAKEG